MVSELRDNTNYRLFEKFSRESILITLVAICLISAAISWARSERAIDVTSTLSVDVKQFEKTEKELTDEVEVWQIYTAKLHAQLIAEGFKPPPLPEE